MILNNKLIKLQDNLGLQSKRGDEYAKEIELTHASTSLFSLCPHWLQMYLKAPKNGLNIVILCTF